MCNFSKICLIYMLFDLKKLFRLDYVLDYYGS